MFARNLESIAGIGIFPLISLLIFFGFFTMLIIYLIKADKSMLERASRIPLQSNDSNL
jgi:cytochrome c oxidase cbb3-type subunit 3